ncbi:MAG: acetyl-CoA decarbonylase/synthase complex subunit gamma [Methanospirillum sp.]|nr:acetyl-CoA decarbonylase/synthase complex subunit gamma [Methanospirillum sp.]
MEIKKKKGIKEISPIDVYKLLPRTNCGECSEANCMAFATKVVNGEASVDLCRPLFTPEHTAAYGGLQELLAPPVKTVTFGSGESAAVIGGKHVLFRHEFTYQYPTIIAIDIADDLDPDALSERVNQVSRFTYSYIGRTLRLDALAIRCVSGDPARFREAVLQVSEVSPLPLILCSHDPGVIGAALSVCADKKPLIFAVTAKNWREMGKVAVHYSCPVVVSASGDLSLLRSLARTLQDWGIEDIVLDPGTYHGEHIATTIHAFTAIRKTACKDFDPLFGHPLLGTPISVWNGQELSDEMNRWQEAYLSSMLITRYADLLIMHSLEGWVLLPQLIWRFGIYTDPRKPVSVDPGVRPFGNPGPGSPVLITSNYALTYFTVEADIKAAKIDCYLVVADTGGLSVEAAVAGRYFSASKIAESLREYKVAEMVSHNYLIIPGLAARLSGETEEESGWRVLVGPRDSSAIGQMIREHWPPAEE